MPVPRSVQLFGRVQLDLQTGGEVRSTTYADPTPDAGVQHLRDIMTDAKDGDFRRTLLIVDGGYQFSVSIGVYVDAPKQRQYVC